jgi:hypothetical protein
LTSTVVALGEYEGAAEAHASRQEPACPRVQPRIAGRAGVLVAVLVGRVDVDAALELQRDREPRHGQRRVGGAQRADRAVVQALKLGVAVAGGAAQRPARRAARRARVHQPAQARCGGARQIGDLGLGAHGGRARAEKPQRQTQQRERAVLDHGAAEAVLALARPNVEARGSAREPNPAPPMHRTPTELHPRRRVRSWPCQTIAPERMGPHRRSARDELRIEAKASFRNYSSVLGGRTRNPDWGAHHAPVGSTDCEAHAPKHGRRYAGAVARARSQRSRRRECRREPSSTIPRSRDLHHLHAGTAVRRALLCRQGVPVRAPVRGGRCARPRNGRRDRAISVGTRSVAREGRGP